MTRPAYLPPRRIYKGTPPVLTLDSRRRAYMGRIGKPEHRVYGVHVDDDSGVVTLTPLELNPEPDQTGTSVERHEDNVWERLGE